MYRKKGREWTKHVDFMLLDILCIQLAFIVAYIFRFGTGNPYMDRDYRILGIAFLLIDFFVEIVSDSFKNVLKRGYFDEFLATCKHVILVEVVTTFYLFTTQMGDIYSRISYYIMVPFYIVISYTARIIWKKILRKRGFHSTKKSILILAPEQMLEETLQTVSKSCLGYTRIVAAALDADLKGKTIAGISIVANHEEIIDFACSEWVDEVFIPPCNENDYPRELAATFMEMGIAVHTGITKAGSIPAGCQQVEKIGSYMVITTSMNYADSSKLFVKRLMDIAGGLVGCLITLLITIIVGPIIYINSPGPIFFSQERIGRNGRKFKMYKFRSMYMDAEARKKELMSQNKISDGMMFKMDFDPRIIGNKILPDGTKKTGIGQFIRKTSLDEFPQFVNILKGDMSLVGTRPPTLDEWNQYKPHHRARMSFRPGLTGLWQVSGRSNITDFEEVVNLDTKYIDEWSLGVDVRILWKTVIGVFKNEDAM
ncbi:sugar transferase [Blautia sp. MSJ-9]|uniref:sugar transferase n=1 Tax=Blautia sp. MSJ-9 TaxID=2841511 RepID=UPI001C1090C6|nr:sugar transferase [Blautia sp. MSJ-9]MBU5679583.1 sugar transferase [Blautia sp. MSJ-9]